MNTPITPPVIYPILLNKLCKKPNLKPEIPAISNEVRTIKSKARSRLFFIPLTT